jgi:hypothetical protein
MLHKIATTFPQVSVEWLVTGKGNALKQGMSLHSGATGEEAHEYAGMAEFRALRDEVHQQKALLEELRQKLELYHSPYRPNNII